MAYFVKGIPQLQKPVSTLGQLNQSLQQQQKIQMMEKQRKQQLLLQAANLKMRQQQADQQLQMQQMRLQQQELTRQQASDRRADTRQETRFGQIRSMQKGIELEPWAEPFFDQLMEQRMLDTNNFRDPDPTKVGLAMDDMLQFLDVYAVNDDYNKQLNAFGNIANDPIEQQKSNKTLSDAFQQINVDETSSRYNNAVFLNNGGLAQDMQIQVGPLGTASSIVGMPFQQFDEQGSPVYGGQVAPVQSSPHYHNPESEYMRTAMDPFFGKSFDEVGQGLHSVLKTKFDGGAWNEARSREYVGGILRTPGGVKGKEWRMRALAGNVVDPSSPTGEVGLYYQLQEDPEVQKAITDMVVNYQLFENNGEPKALYTEYKDEIDAAMKLAEDRITSASDFDNYRAPRQNTGRTASESAAENRASMISSRVPVMDDNGTLGSFYVPEFLQSRPINITMPNGEAVAEWEAKRQAVIEEFLAETNLPPELAPISAEAEAKKQYPDRTRPRDTETFKFDRFEVYPDGTSEGGGATMILKSGGGRRFELSSTDDETWADVTGRLQREGINIADLMNDMDQGWSYDQAAIDRLNPPSTEEPEEVELDVQPTGNEANPLDLDL